MRNILIVSNFFYPEITPRAFRTTELVKEFSRQGYKITLILPNKEIYRDAPFELNNLNILYSNSSLKRNLNREDMRPFSKENKSRNFTKKGIDQYLKSIIFYFFPRELFLVYDRGITRILRHLKGQYCALISISHPLSIHLSVSIALTLNRSLTCKTRMAEFSDPMFKGAYLKTFPSNWLFGFLFSYIFKFFIVPVKSAIPSFVYFKSRKNIKVIPQGFDFSDILIDEKKFIPNSVITFAYAGRFYKDLRDPEYFFKFLETIKSPFIFKLYVPSNDAYFTPLIKSYANKVKGEFIYCDLIPREQLIKELSKVDFLINFNNENSKMVPSKLIDYALTKRPIISFNSKSFDRIAFQEFINGNYEKEVKININEYDIKVIVESINKLITNES